MKRGAEAGPTLQRFPVLNIIIAVKEKDFSPEPTLPEDHNISVVLPQLSYHAKSKGRDVRTLQGLLHARGLERVVGKIDGDFGTKTDNAVRQFQRRALIEVNGLVGEKTWSKLLNEIG